MGSSEFYKCTHIFSGQKELEPAVTYDNLSPENRMSAIWLLIKVLDDEREERKNCGIICIDGQYISYGEAVDVLINMIGKIVSPEIYGEL